MTRKSQGLRVLYHQEIGRIQAVRLKKRMRELGLLAGWFANLNDIIIASGGTQEEALTAARSLVPAEKHEFIHTFQFKPK